MISTSLRLFAVASVALIVLVGGCHEPTSAHKEKPRSEAPVDTLRPAHHFVSFYRLLATPTDFEGKRVQVQGILSISSVENFARLYVNAEAFRNRVVVDSVSLRLTEEQWRRFAALDGRFVALEGEFRRITAADELVEAGVLQPVSRLIDISSQWEGEKPGVH